MATVPIKMNSINIDVSQKDTKVRSKIYDVIVDDEYSGIDLNNNEVEKQENDSQLLDVLAQCGATAAVGGYKCTFRCA